MKVFAHLLQAVWRHAARNFSRPLKTSPKFRGVVRRCLALPFIATDELQMVVDQVWNIPMGFPSIEREKEEFLLYMQNTWMDGVYSPDTWSCFGRKTDMTNNSQESYNYVLNRYVFKHHMKSHITCDLCLVLAHTSTL